ncbi:unnamed protein product [Penicillium glandicola]
MPYGREPMDHWTQQVMKKMTKVRSLVRESYQLLARNDETELSAEIRQIECTLVMILEDSRLRALPPSARLPSSLPPTGLRRGNRRGRGRFTRGPGNGNSRSQPAGENHTQICASGAVDIQIVQARPPSSFGDSIVPTCVEDETNFTKPASSITPTPPSQGVLVDFDEDITVIEVLPGIVATMEALQIVYSEPNGQLEVC